MKQVTPDLRAYLNGLLPGGRSDSGDGFDLVQAMLTHLAEHTRALVFDALATRPDSLNLSPAEADLLEGELLAALRPAIDVVNDTFETPGKPWDHIGDGDARLSIEDALPAVGRISARGTQVGTGFLAGEDLLVTNRHVAVEFAKGLGTEVQLRGGRDPEVDLAAEVEPRDPVVLPIVEAVFIHDFWDVAVLRVDGVPDEVVPLELSTEPPEELVGVDVALIGYPGPQGESAAVTRRTVFRNRFHVKRLQPGKATGRMRFGPREDGRRPLTHDASTLPGSSGSPVVDLHTGKVVGVHFAGKYLRANYAVSTFDLSHDDAFVAIGLDFS